MKQIGRREPGQILKLAGAGIVVEDVKTDAQMGRAALRDQRRDGLQVVAEGSRGLELQRRRKRSLPGLYGGLGERDLRSVEILLTQGSVQIGRHDERFDA